MIIFPEFSKYDNSVECIGSVAEFNVARVPGTNFKKYLARIEGPDTIYNLNRSFLRYHGYIKTCSTVFYEYDYLPKGVYETSVKYFDNETSDLVITDRKYIIWDGVQEAIIYPAHAFSIFSVLDAVVNL